MSKVAQLSIFTAFLFISGWIYIKFYQPETLKPVHPTGHITEIDMVSAKGKWKFVPQEIRIKVSACANGIDDDDDGTIDFPNDPGCASALDNDEAEGLTATRKYGKEGAVLESYSVTDENMRSIADGKMPSEVRVKVGDLVRIKIFNEDGFDHGFALEAFAINRRLFPNQSTFVEFIASKVGTSKFYCSVPCGEGHYQQTGTLIVEE